MSPACCAPPSSGGRAGPGRRAPRGRGATRPPPPPAPAPPRPPGWPRAGKAPRGPRTAARGGKVGGGALWLRGGRAVGTENAYVKAHIAQLSPEISGRVAEVLVHDHMAVSAGQLLVRLDPAPFQMVLDKAMAELDAARIAVETTRAIYVETRSELAEAEINAEFLGRQAQRNLMLQERAVVSATKLDEMQSQAQVAKNRVTVIKRRLDRVLAGLSGNPQLPTDH